MKWSPPLEADSKLMMMMMMINYDYVAFSKRRKYI
jgi:hypothetical protein